MTRVTRVEPGSWPSGVGQTVGVVGITVEAIAQRLGLEVHSGVDDLDDYDFASCVVEPIGQVWLFRYRRSQEARTELIVDRAVARTAGSTAIVRVLRKAMNLTEIEIWQASGDGLPG